MKNPFDLSPKSFFFLGTLGYLSALGASFYAIHLHLLESSLFWLAVTVAWTGVVGYGMYGKPK